MPQIPIALSERSIPGATGSPNMPGNDPIGAAFQQSGQQIGGVASRGLFEQKQEADRIKRAEQHVEAAKHENYLKEWSAKKAEALQGRTDYENFDALADQDSQEIQAYIEKIGDPDVKRAVTIGAQGILHEHNGVIRVKKAQVLTDVGKAELDKNLQFDVQDYVMGNDEEREKIRARMTARIILAKSTGILKETEAVNTDQKVNEIIDETYAAELKNTNPLRLKKELQEGKLLNINPVKRQQLIAETEKAAVQQTATSLLIDLKQKYPDVQKRIEHIESVEFLKTLGDEGAKIQDTLLSYTLREWKTQNDAYKAVSDEKVGAASVKIYQGVDLTEADTAGLRPPELALLERIKDYQTRQNRAELRENRIAEREKRYDARIARQEKSDSIEGDIITRIVNQEPIDITKDIFGRIPDGLSAASANRLVGMVGKTQKDPTFKLGLDVINKAVGIDAATRGRMIIDFRNQVEEEKATGKRIIEIAETLIAPKKTNYVAQLLDGVWKETKERMKSNSFFNGTPGAATTGPSQEDLEFTAKKHGITVDEVKKRMGIQ